MISGCLWVRSSSAVVTHGAGAGTGADFESSIVWVGAQDTHCLFAQYRFEIPLAGARVYAGGTTGGQTTGRQTGHNFTGQYYTLHRHYDPYTMRWTSPDPAASPCYNLFGYCGNNPAGFFDPDGLARAKKWSSDTFTADLIDAGLDVFEGMLTKFYGSGVTVAASGFQMADGENIGDTFVGQQAHQIHQRRDAWLVNYGEDSVAGRLYATGGVLGDMLGLTGIRESVRGRDAVTGRSLSGHERYERGVDGASSLLLTAAMIAAPKVVPWAASVGSGARVGGGVTQPMFRRMTPELAPGTNRALIQYLKDLRREPKPIGSIGIPDDVGHLAWGKWGNTMEQRMANWLVARHGSSEFTLRVRPGQTGIDVELSSGAYPGFRFADFKKRRPSTKTSFERQMKRWGHPANQTKVFTYDEIGNIYEGW